MKAPKCGREITKEWVTHILREHTAATCPHITLQVDDVKVREDLGDGFNSQVVFFSAETTERDETQSSETQHKVYQLVAKLLSQDPTNSAINMKFKSTLREYIIYTELIDDLNKLQNAKTPDEPQIAKPKLLYAKCNRKEFALVMENLEYAGYEINDKRKGLDHEHLKAAVDQIVRVHAISYVYSQSTDVREKYSCFPATQDYVNIFSVLMKITFENCIKFLESSGETEELGKRMKASKSVLFEKLTSALYHKNSVTCFVHGDYWNCNMMFKYTDVPNASHKVIEDVKIIDWGNASWGSPLFDLQYLVHTSTTRTVRKDYLEEVLNHYHATFMRLTTQFGFPPPNWNLDEFKTEWKRTYVCGLLLGCALTQGTLSTTNLVNKKPEPSVLDRPILRPLKVITDNMKMGMAKIMLPLTLSSAGQSLFVGLMRRMLKPVTEELLSGKNEVMNRRLLNLIVEADENGLFTAE